MFGDIGHGIMMFLVGFFLCILSGCLKRNPSLKPMLYMRYVILLMGFFATFCGLLYNDFMAIPLTIFKSCYNFETGERIDEDCTYPVGIDPIWYETKQELVFMNSFKMKVSVILAILQMSLGIFLKASNALYFKNYLDFFHEFIPQILLLWVLFGYMDVLIVIKWLTDYKGNEHEAPSVITTMINMALNGGTVDGRPFIGTSTTNKAISLFFLCKFIDLMHIVIAMICVPWMLFAKPYILKKRSKKEDRHKIKVPYQKAHNDEIEMKDLHADKK
jgi:V-type H+-transporting ATPase subunit a